MPRYQTMAVLRGLLLIILIGGILGTGIELLLLEHTEGFWQLAPLGLLGGALVVLVWHLVARTPASVRGVQVLMLAFLVSGVIGLVLHYLGNTEFELEMHPEGSGFGLFWEALKGATPTLAPGTMIQLGLVGLVYAYRHPALRREAADSSSTTEQ